MNFYGLNARLFKVNNNVDLKCVSIISIALKSQISRHLENYAFIILNKKLSC